MKNKIILIGGGGHCKSVLQGLLRDGMPVHGIVDLPEKLNQSILNTPFVATDDDLPALLKQDFKALVTIGSVKSNERRKKMFDHLQTLGFSFATIVSSRAIVSNGVKIQEGSVVLDGAIINVDSTIGKNCIINSGAIIEHDCVVGDHAHISMGAILSGAVIVSEQAFVGAGAIIKQGIKIGKAAVIGAGTVVVRDVPDHTTVVGAAMRSLV